jgi:hypothetical protein
MSPESVDREWEVGAMSVKGRMSSLAARAAVAAVLVGLAAVAARAYVPTCVEQRAAAYPPALRADLSACDEKAEFVRAQAPVDRSLFATRLNGTWGLKSWTVFGVTDPELPRSARLYFDVAAGEGTVEGSALFIEGSPGALLPADADVEAARTHAFWTIGIGVVEKRLVSLVMKGDPRSSVTNANPRLSEATRFSALDDVFVGIEAGSSSPAWDRIVLSRGLLTYVSCKRGIVQRYTKISDERPLIEGMTLAAYWKRVTSRRVAQGRELARPVGTSASAPASPVCCTR